MRVLARVPVWGVIGLILMCAAAPAVASGVEPERVQAVFRELRLPLRIGEYFPTHTFHSAALGDREAGFGPIPGAVQRALFPSDHRVWRYAVGRIELTGATLLITYRDFSTRAADEAVYTLEVLSPWMEAGEKLTIARRTARVDAPGSSTPIFRSHWSQASLYEIDAGIRIIIWVTQMDIEIGSDEPDRMVRVRRDYLVRHDGTIIPMHR